MKAGTKAIKQDSSPLFNLDRRLYIKALIGLASLLGVAYLCGSIFREPIIAAGAAAMESLGLTGLFLGVIVTDASPLPLTNEPLVILSISGGIPTWTVFFVVSAASVTAGIVGYTGGLLVGSRTPLGAWIKRRYPGFETFMNRYGAIGVAICAFLPIPFALSTWSAGMTRIGLPKVALASLVRIPKTAFYVWLIVTGWSMGANLAGGDPSRLPDCNEPPSISKSCPRGISRDRDIASHSGWPELSTSNHWGMGNNKNENTNTISDDNKKTRAVVSTAQRRRS